MRLESLDAGVVTRPPIGVAVDITAAPGCRTGITWSRQPGSGSSSVKRDVTERCLTGHIPVTTVKTGAVSMTDFTVLGAAGADKVIIGESGAAAGMGVVGGLAFVLEAATVAAVVPTGGEWRNDVTDIGTAVGITTVVGRPCDAITCSIEVRRESVAITTRSGGDVGLPAMGPAGAIMLVAVGTGFITGTVMSGDGFSKDRSRLHVSMTFFTVTVCRTTCDPIRPVVVSRLTVRGSVAAADADHQIKDGDGVAVNRGIGIDVLAQEKDVRDSTIVGMTTMAVETANLGAAVRGLAVHFISMAGLTKIGAKLRLNCWIGIGAEGTIGAQDISVTLSHG